MCSENFEILEPRAGSITESLRSIGYSLETAIADLIDNSITANASEIRIWGEYKGANTVLYIWDNGDGMDEATLVEAMRLGSSKPSEKRNVKDLGRFGLGLKTASFSQCKRFSVISKKDGRLSSRFWDLDVINVTNEWRLRKDVNPDFIELLSPVKHGTLIVWEKLDRVITVSCPDAEKRFNHKKNLLRQHLGITFHRFIASGRLRIKIGGVEVEGWNPFLSGADYAHKKELPVVSTCGGAVQIKAWIMPHRSYFSDADYKKAGFNKGWTNMQGFYVYRADRLLVAGGWLGLGINGHTMRQEHHYDLARICVDISNDYDFDWDIDIKKSKAIPPDYLKFDLENIAKQARKLAYETYVFGGRQIHLRINNNPNEFNCGQSHRKETRNCIIR